VLSGMEAAPDLWQLVVPWSYRDQMVVERALAAQILRHDR